MGWGRRVKGQFKGIKLDQLPLKVGKVSHAEYPMRSHAVCTSELFILDMEKASIYLLDPCSFESRYLYYQICACLRMSGQRERRPRITGERGIEQLMNEANRLYLCTATCQIQYKGKTRVCSKVGGLYVKLMYICLL